MLSLSIYEGIIFPTYKNFAGSSWMAGSIVSPKRVLMTGWISWKNKNMDDSAGNGKAAGIKKDRSILVGT